jgi:hypothetical protein
MRILPGTLSVLLATQSVMVDSWSGTIAGQTHAGISEPTVHRLGAPVWQLE